MGGVGNTGSDAQTILLGEHCRHQVHIPVRVRYSYCPATKRGDPTCIPDGVHKVVPSRFREQLELTSTEGSFLAQESNGPASDGGVTVTVLQQAEKG